MKRSRELSAARKNRADEFYTGLEDISKEVLWYSEQFRDKIVYCNCDNLDSNFVRYFVENFSSLRLKVLISTGYRKDGRGDIFYLDREKFGFGKTDDEGSYDSEDCEKLLELSDIVVTNPPFSLFRKYLRYLKEKEKKFLLIGNINVVTNKDIFSLIQSGELRLGASIHSGDREFRVPDDYPLEAAGVDIRNGQKYIRVKGVRWFTNLEHEYLPELRLEKTLETAVWQKYDGYDAINVDKVSEIPKDYTGKIGVPITYLDKHRPDLYDIIGLDVMLEDNPRPNKRLTVGGKETYARIIIRKK